MGNGLASFAAELGTASVMRLIRISLFSIWGSPLLISNHHVDGYVSLFVVVFSSYSALVSRELPSFRPGVTSSVVHEFSSTQIALIVVGIVLAGLLLGIGLPLLWFYRRRRRQASDL